MIHHAAQQEERRSVRLQQAWRRQQLDVLDQDDRRNERLHGKLSRNFRSLVQIREPE